MMCSGWRSATVLGVALLGAACGDGSAVEHDEDSVEMAEDDDTAAEAGPAGPVDVALGETELGQVLVDGVG